MDNDCIFRREVLELVEKESGGYTYIETPTENLLSKVRSIPPVADGLPAWTSTEENPPKVGEPVLIARKIRHNDTVLVEPATLRPDGTWKAIGHKIQPSSVSHWMSMPKPPKEANT